MKTNKELLKENEALLATVECLKSIVNGTAFVMSAEISDRGPIVSDRLNQHLAAIKANAVFSVAYEWIVNTDSDYDVRAKLIEISSKLRG